MSSFVLHAATGVDSFGNTYADSAEASCSTTFDNISGTGANTGISGDDSAGDVVLPFTFELYGTGSTQLRVGTNGGARLNVTTGTLPFTNLSLPEGGQPLGIFPLWDDFVVNASADIFSQTKGTAPNRRTIIQWNDVARFGVGGSAFTFQIVLYEGSNNIDFVYLDVDPGDGSVSLNGGSATIGLNQDGTDALQYSFNTASLASVTAICFSPPSIIVDSDGDGILDTVERDNGADRDTDGDGVFDHLDIDSDNDGIPDNVEAQLTALGSYIAPAPGDADGDGLLDVYEPNGLNPIDTDGEFLPDYIDEDSDGEGIPDYAEARPLPVIEPTGGDTDGDGLLDVYEGSNVNDVDVNDEFDTPSSDLDDNDGDCCTTPLQSDVNYRDLNVPQAVLSKVGTARNTGSTTDVAENDLIDWVVRYSNPTGFTIRNVLLADDLTGSHTIVSRAFPDGWVVDAGGFNGERVLGSGFGRSNKFTDVPIAGNTQFAQPGGDGYYPIIDPDTGFIYAMYHHSAPPQQLACVDPEFGTACPGFATAQTLPASGADFGSGTLSNCDVVGQTDDCNTYTINTNEATPMIDGVIYYPTTLRNNGEPFGTFDTWGLGCYDVNTQDECAHGFVQLSTAATPSKTGSNGALSGAWLVNGNLYLMDWEMNLHCVTPGTGASCGTTALFDAATMPTLSSYLWEAIRGEVYEDRLYLAVLYENTTNSAGLGGARARCIDLSGVSPTDCTGWPSGQGTAFSGPGNEGSGFEKMGNLFFVRDTNSDPTLVCTLNEGVASTAWDGCVSITDGSAVAGGHEGTGIPSNLGLLLDTNAGSNGAVGKEVFHRGRTYFPRYFDNFVSCWDWADQAACSGFGASGIVTGPANAETYSVERDPKTGCFWVLGDNNELWNFDVQGNSPCLIAEVTSSQAIEPEAAYCDSQATALLNADWQSLDVFDIDITDFTTMDIELYDTTTGSDVLVTTCDYVASTCTNGYSIVVDDLHHAVDLSTNLDISVNTSLRVDLIATLPLGTELRRDGIDPRIEIGWDFNGAPTPVEFCVVTDPSVECPVSGQETATNTANARIQGSLTPDSVVTTSLNIFPVGVPDTGCRMDYGDAPESYGTSLSRVGTSGAGHSILTTANTLFIGSAVDNEADGLPSAAADGDNGDISDDEQGVTFISPGGNGRPEVIATAAVVNDTGGDATVCAWLDRWDGSGNGSTAFVSGDEQDGGATCQIVADNNGTASDVTFRWNSGLAAVAGTTFARFRVCTVASECNTPLGTASDGEVEDYQILFDFTPTAVTIGEVSLNSLEADDFLSQLGVAQLDNANLMAILQSWDASAAAQLDAASRDELITALKGYLDPDGDGKVAVLTWDTIEERGTIGFYVERNVNGEAAWVKVNNDLLPGLINAPMGGEYILADPEVQSNTPYNFRLIELEATGKTRSYGPYPLEIKTAD